MNMTRKEKAVEIFNRKFHCSQAILAAFADECGLTEKTALRLGGCFGSGMRRGEVCGACTGALMVLGAMYGQCDETDLQSRELANRVNDHMMKLFAERVGSYMCRDILGVDITTAEGVQYARENHLFTELCPRIVAAAADVLEEIIAENGEPLSGDDK